MGASKSATSSCSERRHARPANSRSGEPDADPSILLLLRQRDRARDWQDVHPKGRDRVPVLLSQVPVEHAEAGPRPALDPMDPSVPAGGGTRPSLDRKSTRLNSSHITISYAVFCLKKKTQ